MDHVRLLAEVFSELPPILVREDGLTVVDGAHRLEAARLRGETTVAVTFFAGSDEDAYIEAIQRNVEHGKPLQLLDRRRAAIDILRLRPDWSDRRIASVCALDAKTVASIRATAEVPQSRGRVGRDGRERPSDPSIVRQQVADLIREHPEASLRAIAREAGTSPSTVRDVRRRLVERSVSARAEHTPGPSPTDVLGADASLVNAPNGQALLAWLQRTEVRDEEWESLLDELPLSRLYVVAEEARRRAQTWSRMASDAETLARKRATARRVEV